MPTIIPLSSKELYRTCDPSLFDFQTTEELDEFEQFIGQDRAVASAHFAFGMNGSGYNLFAYGPKGTGKNSLVLGLLKEKALEKKIPCDWCYVNNFQTPHKPHAISFPPAHARLFSHAMDQLIDDLKATIPQAFEQDEYRQRRDSLDKKIEDHQEQIFSVFSEKAKRKYVGLLRTPTGFALVPLKEGKIIKQEDFSELPAEEQEQRKKTIGVLEEELTEVIVDLQKGEKSHRQSVRVLNREVTQFAVHHQIMDLRKIYDAHEGVLLYLDEVEEDVIENLQDFLPVEQPVEGTKTGVNLALQSNQTKTFVRYKVNVIIDHSCIEGEDCDLEFNHKRGAPVIEEDHPTLPNMLGRIENVTTYGTWVTDFTLIKAGALHKANGGYLILDALKILTQPFAWEALKRALNAGSIRIESAAESYGMANIMTLEPEPIPLDVKVVLLGDAHIYYMLNQIDPDFHELFKVAADFDSQMVRTDEATQNYAQFIATYSRQNHLKPIDRFAVARIVEFGSRLSEDSERLTTHMASIVDLIREADYWSEQDKKKNVTKKHVERAIEAKVYRSDRIRERILDEIQRGIIHIDTEGEVVGQINGLAVLMLDHFMFGRPARISCTVRMGHGEVVNIEREVALSGPLHSKGVLILTSFLAHRFAKNRPLSLTANLVFEQSYSGIDGDSASSTELYCLLSALADVPIKQSLAVTGSVDQYGRVQAIGGVNEKIEGFFDVCKTRKLKGPQGVLIPKDNVKHLMLREDVIKACEKGDFHIYPVETIDQGIEILTGIEAGEIDENDEYPIGSINRLVSVRLNKFTRRWFELAQLKGG